MKFCRNCGRQLADDAAFCDACGTRSAAQPIANSETINSQPEAHPVQPQPSSSDQAPSGVREKKKRGKKTLFIVLAVILALIAAAVAVWWLLGREPSGPSSPMSAQPYTDYALYVKDNAVYYVDLNELESQYIYSYDEEGATSSDYLWDYETDMLYGTGVKISRNGKALVYCKHSGRSSELYYRNLEGSNREILIDKLEAGGSIRDYHISDDGKTVTYIKVTYSIGETGAEGSCSVYQFNGTEKEKLFSVKGWSGIDGIAVSPDGKQIYYEVDTDPNLWAGVQKENVPEEAGCFWWRKGEGAEKICSVFTECQVSLDVSAACYLPDETQDDAGTLYRKEFGEEPEILARNVLGMCSQYLRWPESWYSEDLSTVYYFDNKYLYQVDAEGRIKQVDAIEYLYPQIDQRSWPKLTFEEERQSDRVEYGALYMDGVLIDKETSRDTSRRVFMPEYLPESQSLIYFKDANIVSGAYIKEEGATMMLYNGEESIKVGTNVFDYHAVSNNRIFYWCQADNSEYAYEVYDLYYFDGQKSHLIERDAQGFLPVWDTPAYRPVLD